MNNFNLQQGEKWIIYGVLFTVPFLIFIYFVWLTFTSKPYHEKQRENLLSSEYASVIDTFYVKQVKGYGKATFIKFKDNRIMPLYLEEWRLVMQPGDSL